MDITEFLLARIAEDEAVAVDVELVPMGYSWRTISWLHGANREHGRRWDPTRVMAECQAKRQVVEICREFKDEEYDGNSGTLDGLDRILQSLALPYAGHPDYNPEWKL